MIQGNNRITSEQLQELIDAWKVIRRHTSLDGVLGVSDSFIHVDTLMFKEIKRNNEIEGLVVTTLNKDIHADFILDGARLTGVV